MFLSQWKHIPALLQAGVVGDYEISVCSLNITSGPREEGANSSHRTKNRSLGSGTLDIMESFYWHGLTMFLHCLSLSLGTVRFNTRIDSTKIKLPWMGDIDLTWHRQIKGTHEGESTQVPSPIHHHFQILTDTKTCMEVKLHYFCATQVILYVMFSASLQTN